MINLCCDVGVNTGKIECGDIPNKYKALVIETNTTTGEKKMYLTENELPKQKRKKGRRK
jgi:hypothetical protein